jgi:Protein of unknown function (DUF1826)
MSNECEVGVGHVESEGAAVLSHIYGERVSLSIWCRRQPLAISTGWLEAATATEWSVRERVDAEFSRASAVLNHLPPGDSRAAFVDDLQFIVGMLADLAGASELGLRLETVDRDVCSAWHVDRVSMRLITTYYGPATEWINNSHVWRNPQARGAAPPWFVLSPSAAIQRLRPFDVGVFKGTAWDPPHQAVVHRSPRVPDGRRRLLLTVDPLG